MNAYKIKYEDGTTKTVLAENSLQVIKRYDLATKKHINTRIFQLEGEQKAIAFSELDACTECGSRMVHTHQ